MGEFSFFSDTYPGTLSETGIPYPRNFFLIREKVFGLLFQVDKHIGHAQ
jgi:hypothetical protein